MAPPTKSSYTIGVLLLSDGGVQFLDIGSVDLFATMKREYFELLSLPESTMKQAIDCSFHYITETGNSPFAMSGGVQITITVRLPPFHEDKAT